MVFTQSGLEWYTVCQVPSVTYSTKQTNKNKQKRQTSKQQLPSEACQLENCGAGTTKSLNVDSWQGWHALPYPQDSNNHLANRNFHFSASAVITIFSVSWNRVIIHTHFVCKAQRGVTAARLRAHPGLQPRKLRLFPSPVGPTAAYLIESNFFFKCNFKN